MEEGIESTRRAYQTEQKNQSEFILKNVDKLEIFGIKIF